MWINGNNGNMLHFFRFMRTQEYKSELRESLRNEAPFWRERGTIRFNEWWIVDCYMLEHRKEQKCLIQPFYKKIPLPGSILNSHLSNLSFLVDSWYHLVGIWESRRMLNISFINIFRIPLLSPTCLFCTTLLPLRSMSNKKMQRMLHFLFILFT